jgi:hypothetical protein
MIKSAFQIPHHVAIRTCALLRHKLLQNIGAGGDGFSPKAEKE